MPDEPVLDESIVDGLRRLGSGTLGDIVRLWFEHLDPNVSAMRSALAAGDEAALVATAHTLRGSAANVGAARLAASCAALEVAAKQGSEPDALGRLLDTVAADAMTAQAAMTGIAEGPTG